MQINTLAKTFLVTIIVLFASSFAQGALAQETRTYWQDGPKVYLTKQAASINESFIKVSNDRGWYGGPIRTGGKTYARGLGVHADSKLVFPLNGKFTKFHVVPGPDDGYGGTIRLVIKIDEKIAYDSGPVSRASKQKPPVLNLDVTNAINLTLLVKKADGKIGGDHAIWADAYLERPWKNKFAKKQLPQNTIVPRHKLQRFFTTYCIECHGPDEQESGLRFDTISWKIANNDQAQRWQDILDQLNGGDMPPKDETQPSTNEMSGALDVLTKSLVTARNRLTDHGGKITLRRLNRREYSNTIQELFGFSVDNDDIPEDGEISSFDTVGAEQLFTSLHFEKFLELGKKVGREGIMWNTRKHMELSAQKSEPERRHTKKLRKRLADLDRKMAMKKSGKSWQEMGFKDEGEAEIIFRQFHVRAGYPRRYLEYPKVESGAYLSDIVKWVSLARHVDLRGEYVVRIHGGVVGNPDDIRKIVKVVDRNGVKAILKMQGTPENPETIEFRTRQPLGRWHMPLFIHENKPDFTINSSVSYNRKIQGPRKEFDPWSTLWVDWVEIEGPFYPKKKSRLESLLYANGEEPGGKSRYFNIDWNARDFIERFAFEAFRRKTADPAYVDALHERFKTNRKSGQHWWDSMSEVVGIVLTSPDFLYLREENSGTRNLDSRELAIRLSYFLWSSPPDEQLYGANLLDPNELVKQVDRMLQSPRSKAFRDGFIDQWAELDRFDAITVDERKYFRFNTGLRHSAKQEVREFFGTILKENLSVSNFIESDFVTVNPALAVHYGIKGVEAKDDRFIKVKLPKDSPRGGLMTQTAFLVAGSNGERTSPVIRGALVMEKLLHDKPAPPPPNVPELGSAGNRPKTNREMVKLHQKQAVCASCHRKMDVIGFGLENFDVDGSWRKTEPVGRRAVVIDPSGTLPNGQAFADVKAMKKLLLQQEDKLVRELTESILAYALGRTVEFSDSNEVDRLVRNITRDGGRIKTMIREIVLSPLFKRK